MNWHWLILPTICNLQPFLSLNLKPSIWTWKHSLISRDKSEIVLVVKKYLFVCLGCGLASAPPKCLSTYRKNYVGLSWGTALRANSVSGCSSTCMWGPAVHCLVSPFSGYLRYWTGLMREKISYLTECILLSYFIFLLTSRLFVCLLTGYPPPYVSVCQFVCFNCLFG